MPSEGCEQEAAVTNNCQYLVKKGMRNAAKLHMFKQEVLHRSLTLRERIHAVFDADGFDEERYSSKHKKITTGIFLLTFVMIILSCVTFTVESMTAFHDRGLPVFYIIEAVCIGWFTIELVIRMVTCSSLRKFIKDPLNWIDVISIIPFYIDLLSKISSGSNAKADGLIVLRTIRLTRVFRVFKLSKYSEGVQIVFIAIKRSTDALSLLVFLMSIAMVLFGSGIYFAELGAANWSEANRTWYRLDEYGGGEHNIQSIPHGFWWCLVTVTTVGYGDMVPVTFLGRLVGIITMLTGLLIVAFPIIILGANFQEVQEEQKKAKSEKRKQEHAMEMILLGKEKVSEVLIQANEEIQRSTTDAPADEVQIEGPAVPATSPTTSLVNTIQTTANRQEEILDKILKAQSDLQLQISKVESLPVDRNGIAWNPSS